MSSVDFAKFVNDIEKKISKMEITHPERFTSKITSTDCEKTVVMASVEVIKEQGLPCLYGYKEGGHAFPDIIYKFESGEIYGIEVKSSVTAKTSEGNWEILGNSILGSTRVDVIDTYIIFIKINNKGVFIKSGRYSDSVADIVVTHSPRYKINLDQKPNTSFFARSGIPYNVIKLSDDPISIVTDYFRKKGETAWWLSESAPATIKDWADLSLDEQDEVYGKAFLLFPEILFCTNSIKYKRFAKWLAATYSVVDSSVRDKFSAGGRIDLEFKGKIYKDFPRVYQTFNDHFSSFSKQLSTFSSEELPTYWPLYAPSKDTLLERKMYWLREMPYNSSFTLVNEEFIKAKLAEVNGP